MTEEPRELTESEYMASFKSPMRDVTETADQVVDLWPYAETSLQAAYPDLCTCDCDVKTIYESPDGSYQHILIPVPIDNVYLVIVIDKKLRQIQGYHKLDLGAMYGVGQS